MYTAEIVPLAYIPRPHAQTLSYFVPRYLPPGALVEIALGSRSVQGVILAVKDVRGSKFEIRQNPFSLKSVRKIISDIPSYTKEQLALADWISEKYWASSGKSYALLVPRAAALSTPSLISNSRPLRQSFSEASELEIGSSGADVQNSPPPIFIQGQDRVHAYAELLRSVLGKKTQALLLVPNTSSLNAVQQALAERNIASVAYHSGMAKKAAARVVEAVTLPQTPLVVVGMRSSLFLPFHKLGLLVIDQPGDIAYDAWGRSPRYHAVPAAEKLAELHGANLAYGDMTPTVLLQQKINEKRCVTRPTQSEARRSIPSVEIVDLRREIKWSPRHPLAPRTRDLLRTYMRPATTVSQGLLAQAIVFIGRKGLASAMICRTCGWVLRCEKCDAAMILHETYVRFLQCHHCGAKRETPNACLKCGSHRFFPSGAGSAQVVKDLEWLLAGSRIMRVDGDTAKTEKELERLLKKFRDGEADVLVGTQRMLRPELLPKVVMSVALGPESALAFPEYDGTERAWRTLQTLHNVTIGTMIIQSSNPDLPFIHASVINDTGAFLDGELARRNMLRYPPFGELIKITVAHNIRFRAQRDADVIAQNVRRSIQSMVMTPDNAAPSLLGPSPSFISKERGKWRFSILLKIPADMLPAIRNDLLSLIPPSATVDVNASELM